jgi:hypothetical protein
VIGRLCVVAPCVATTSKVYVPFGVAVEDVDVDEPDPPAQAAKLATITREIIPKRSVQERGNWSAFLRRNAKGNPRNQKKNPHPAALVDSREMNEAAWETAVVTVTLKVAVPPLLSVRDEGVTEHAAFTGTCVQVNVTMPVEPGADTMERE